jgi:alkaline phosphatase D
MADAIRFRKPITRRRLLTGAGSLAALGALSGIARPHLSHAATRPQITHGIQSGDVSIDSGVVWARTDRPARMVVEASTTDRFSDIRAVASVDALPESDFTTKALLENLPAGQDIFYRIRFEDLSSPTIFSETQVGHFRTAPNDRRAVSFVWSGDTAGQGWGIDEARGGMRTYATMLNNRPDFFVHSGDTIYADCPISRELKLPNGELWRNLVTEEKSNIAQTLADYRGNYKYNLLDANLRQFNAAVPTIAQWDDHEVADDWWPGQIRGNRPDTNASLLAARGRRAFCEYLPIRQTLAEPGRVYRKMSYGPLLDLFLLDMRSYRGPNDRRNDTAPDAACPFLGPAQTEWLKRSLMGSTATWKVICADLPIGLISEDSVAQGDGAPLGREVEIADILAFIKHASIHNTVWITADMHYTAAHHYDPNRAVFQDFEPFWEFVSGPIHAGTWGPGQLDNTFGPAALFQKGCTTEQGENLAPCFGLQFFGHIAIDSVTEVMTVTLKDVGDHDLWSTRIEPKVMRWTNVSAAHRI